ncbi:hypothetical protein BIW11_05771, partial [Tropilaelaps mercedesae]
MSTSANFNGPGGMKWHAPNSRFLRCIGKVEKCTSPRQLLTYCNDLLIGWSDKNRCLYAVVISDEDTDDRCYELTLTHRVPFRVDRLCPSSSGFLLLWGANGAAVVTLPHYDALRRARENTPIQCKSWGVGELLLMQTPGLELLGLNWLPNSATEVVMLTNDNCLRLFDVSKKHMNAIIT